MIGRKVKAGNDTMPKKKTKGRFSLGGRKSTVTEEVAESGYEEDLSLDDFDDLSVEEPVAAPTTGRRGAGRTRHSRRRKQQQVAEVEEIAEPEVAEEPEVTSEPVSFFDSSVLADQDSGSSMDIDDFTEDSFGNLSSENNMTEEEKVEENNAEIEILDLFQKEHDMGVMEATTGPDLFVPELEPEPEQEEEPEFEITADSVLGALNQTVRVLREKVTRRISQVNDVEIRYVDQRVPTAIHEDYKLLLANHRVYVTYLKKDWDELFEVKAKCGKVIEIETGVSFLIPPGYSLEVSVSDKNREKYSVDFEPMILTREEAAMPLIFKLTSCEGGYVSRIGRVIECKLVKE